MQLTYRVIFVLVHYPIMLQGQGPGYLLGAENDYQDR